MESCMAATCAAAASGSSAALFTQLIQTLLTAQCAFNNQESYPSDRTEEILSENLDFDFIVVGGGSAGSVVGARLSEVPNWRVLVIESGDDPSTTSDIPGNVLFLQGTEEDYQYKVKHDDRYCRGLKNRQCAWSKGKALGGSSVINAMLYIRGNDRDYDQWAEMGNVGWSYKDVLPYFVKIENYHPDIPAKYGDKFGTGGPLTLRHFNYTETRLYDIMFSAAKDTGIPIIDFTNAEQYIGYKKTYVNVDNGVRQNIAKAYLNPIKDRKNLYVMKSTRVDSVVLDGNKATGVKITLKDGRKIQLKAAKEIILSAGSIATPQILMLSGIGPKDQLESHKIEVVTDLPVGKNLQDHVIWMGIYLTYTNKTAQPTSPTFVFDWAYEYLMQRKGELAAAGGIDLLGFINTKDPTAKYPNIEFHHTQIPQNQIIKVDAIQKAFKLSDEIADDLRRLGQEGEIIIISPTLLNPQSRGQLKLKSANPEDQIEIHANYFDVREDVDILLESLDTVHSFLDTKTFKELGIRLYRPEISECKKYPMESKDYWECNLRHTAGTVYHPVGTCKMGPVSNNNTVVDPNLKVRNVQGLRVVDASIMPKITSANTHATTLMIAEKGSDLIKKEWLLKDEL